MNLRFLSQQYLTYVKAAVKEKVSITYVHVLRGDRVRRNLTHFALRVPRLVDRAGQPGRV